MYKLPPIHGFNNEEQEELQRDFDHALEITEMFRNESGILEFADEKQFISVLKAILPKNSPVFFDGKMY